MLGTLHRPPKTEKPQQNRKQSQQEKGLFEETNFRLGWVEKCFGSIAVIEWCIRGRFLCWSGLHGKADGEAAGFIGTAGAGKRGG